MPILDSESIYPKRLGLMKGNILVLEYYNIAIDKFKKHPIPFDSSQQSKNIIEQIFKDPKHIPYLKKVDPKTIKSVIEGHRVFPKKQGSLRQRQTNFNDFYEQPINKNSNARPVVIESYHPEQEKIVIKPQIKVDEKQQHKKKEEIDEYYDEQFQEFQISQSFDKKNITLNSLSNVEKSKVEESKSSVSKSQKDSISSEKSKSAEQVASKKGKKKVAVEEVINEQYQDDFQFLDEQAQNKKKKKEKKEKKEKSKQKKEKSKEKKSKKEKQAIKPAKPQNTQIQQQFQFL